MSILLENQLHETTGPLAHLFSLLDVHHQGSLSIRDIHRIAEQFCQENTISFLQKKMLFFLLTKAYTQLQSNGTPLTFSTLVLYGPKIVSVFTNTSHSHPSTTNKSYFQIYQQQAQQHHQQLSQNDTILPLSSLSIHLCQLLPNILPNKKIMSAFLAHILHKLCSWYPQENPNGISSYAWSETAIAVLYEIERHQ